MALCPWIFLVSKESKSMQCQCEDFDKLVELLREIILHATAVKKSDFSFKCVIFNQSQFVI